MYKVLMPNILSVCCPDCGKHASFTFSVGRSINRKDRLYFEKSKSFQTEMQNTASGRMFVAWYDYGLARKSINFINDLPTSFSPSDFYHNQYYSRYGRTRGVVVCNHCNFRRLHRLSWPEDAYFKIDYKGHELWAFNREMGSKILEYLKSPERKKRVTGIARDKDFRFEIVSQHIWLRKLPSVFQTKKAMPYVVAKLEKLLSL